MKWGNTNILILFVFLRFSVFLFSAPKVIYQLNTFSLICYYTISKNSLLRIITIENNCSWTSRPKHTNNKNANIWLWSKVFWRKSYGRSNRQALFGFVIHTLHDCLSRLIFLMMNTYAMWKKWETGKRSGTAISSNSRYLWKVRFLCSNCAFVSGRNIVIISKLAYKTHTDWPRPVPFIIYLWNTEKRHCFFGNLSAKRGAVLWRR